jgi:hypothetical protein
MLGTANLNMGVATFTTSMLSAGDHNIAAIYGGDNNNMGSTSSDLRLTVNQPGVMNPPKIATTTTLMANPNSPMSNNPVTLTATVAGAGTPTGTVTFLDGATTLGTAILLANGQATFTTSPLAIGNHSITAIYGGDNNDLSSTSVAQTLMVRSPQVPDPPNPQFLDFNPGQRGPQAIRVPVAIQPGFQFPKRFVLEVDGPGRVAYGVATIIWRHPRIPHPRVSNPVVVQPTFF